jgi:hypothetical protein
MVLSEIFACGDPSPGVQEQHRMHVVQPGSWFRLLLWRWLSHENQNLASPTHQHTNRTLTLRYR